MSRFARKLEGISIIEALREPMLLGASLIGDIELWSAWLTFLASFFGLPLSVTGLALYRDCTARHTSPAAPFSTVYLICGRGAGKSFMLSLVAVYLACFRDWTSKLAPGGVPVVLLVSPTREQAKINLSYIVGILDASPTLRRLVTNVTSNSVQLRTGVTIETGVANYRSIRGRSVCCALIDEAAFLKSETSANPDVELMNAIMPSLGRFGTDGILLVGSTPFAKRGILYEGFRSYHGVDDSAALCWVSPTRTMNPTFSQAVIDAALAKDYPKNSAEYLARWRDDVSGFLTREAIDACVMPGVRERGPQAGIKYVGAVDPAGGGPDSYTLAIAHRAGDIMVLDAIRERKGSPEAATQEYAALLKSYGIGTVVGDNYAGTWPKEAFARYGITYVKEDRPRTAIYLAVLPLINSQRVELLDGQPKMLVQFLNLVRTAGPSGRDIVNHPESGGYHDDLSNVASLALVLASVAAQPMTFPLVPQGISRSDFVAEYARDILNPGLGIPGCGYDSCEKPGGFSYGEGPGANFDQQFGWSCLGNHKRN